MERIVKRTQVPDYRAFSAIPSSLRIDPISTRGAIATVPLFGASVSKLSQAAKNPRSAASLNAVQLGLW